MLKTLWGRVPKSVKWGILGMLALAAAFTGGRYSRPARVETRVVEVEKVVVKEVERVVERKVEGPVRVVVKTITEPSGERIEWRTEEHGATTTETNTDRTAEATTERVKDERTLTLNAQPSWRVGATAYVQPSLRLDLTGVKVGVSVERRMFWNVYLGVSAVPQAKLYGVSLSLTF